MSRDTYHVTWIHFNSNCFTYCLLNKIFRKVKFILVYVQSVLLSLLLVGLHVFIGHLNKNSKITESEWPTQSEHHVIWIK